MQPNDNGTHLTRASSLDADQLRDLYAYPAELSQPWLRVNFVCSIDGAVTVDGRSGGLGTPSDKKVFTTLRQLTDVILVGAGTVRTEDYRGARTNERLREWRLEHGLAAVPPVAVVSASAHIDPAARLFTDTSVPPLILTSQQAPDAAKNRLTEAGARVLELGVDSVSTVAILDTLADLGLSRILCEGGPSLFGQFLADDAVDELCLTTSPVLAGGQTGRISFSPKSVDNPMACGHVLAEDDGTVLTRWVRAR